MNLKAGWLGSCRIYTPLKIASDNGSIEMCSNGIFGFIHSTQEVLQVADIMDGSRAPPEELHELLSINNPNLLSQAQNPVKKILGLSESLLERWMKQLDVLVIEVSSIRLIQYNKWQLQIHKFRRMLDEFPETSQITKHLFNDKPSWEDHFDLTDDMPQLYHQIIPEIVCEELPEQKIIQDLKNICDRFDTRILFVNQLTTNFKGEPIRQRQSVAESLSKTVEDCPNAWCIDPTPWIVEHGISSAMKDLGHYNPEFEIKMSRLLTDHIKDICNTQ